MSANMETGRAATDPHGIAGMGVTELAGAIAGGALAPGEVVAEFVGRIALHNEALNAYVFVAGEQAAQEAVESERRIAAGNARPLEGVPIAIKDDTVVAGMPTSDATAMVGSRITDRDAHLVGRLRDAGAIVLGKTNLPEFGTLAVTEGVRWGACRNPWDTTRTPGGSSGGSAAAVAARMAPAAHGNDGGGSLRIPASCCGLFTVKPTRGRLSVAPYTGESALNAHGFLTRSVLDNAVLMDVTQGNVAGDPFWATPPVLSYAHEVRRAADAPRMRIAWTATPPIDAAVHPACAAAVHAAAAACAALGHSVEEVTPDWCDSGLQADFMDMWSVLIGSFAEYLVDGGGDIDAAEPHNRALYERGRAIPATTYLNVASRLRRLVRRTIVTWESCDVVLTPTLAQPPLAIGALFQHQDEPLSVVRDLFAFTPFTPLVNLTGQPAAQLPLSLHEGLPIGVQAIARPGDEGALFRLSAELEQARPWKATCPALFA